jgi:DNA-binding LacI/PurR family transcriptional regulator
MARAAGVSHTTVSNAFNRRDQLSRAVRERVVRIATELGYGGPDPAGRSLRTGRADALAVVLSERLSYAFDDPTAARFLAGVADATQGNALPLTLLPSPRIRRRPARRHAALP